MWEKRSSAAGGGGTKTLPINHVFVRPPPSCAPIAHWRRYNIMPQPLETERKTRGNARRPESGFDLELPTNPYRKIISPGKLDRLTARSFP